MTDETAYSRWLALTALSYAVLHHLGSLPHGLGDGPDATRWADWLDLLVPWLVLLPATLTLRAARATEGTWWHFGAGAVAYVAGHGIHLAANSIGNAHPSETAHLWDEVVGHTIWYVGVAVVLASLVETMGGRDRPGPVGYVLALAVGLTWSSNAIGGGTELFAALFAFVMLQHGWWRRHELGVVLLVVFVPALVVLAVHWSIT